MTKPPSRRPAPATAGLARLLYEKGVPLAEISRQTGLSPGRIYYWADREAGPDGAMRLKPVRRRKGARAPLRGGIQETVQGASQETSQGASQGVAPETDDAADASPRARLLARLWRTAERQVAEIEARLHLVAGPSPAGGLMPPRPPADAEKDARALALLARTLRELAAAEDDAAPNAPTDKASDDDDSMRDLDAFRRELAGRLDRLREEGDGPEAAG